MVNLGAVTCNGALVSADRDDGRFAFATQAGATYELVCQA